MAQKFRLNQWLLRFIKSSDAFGHPITLSYKDSSTYKSIFGGVVTLLARISLLVYFLIQITSVFQRQVCYITASTTYENLGNSQRTVNLNKDNFDIGLAIYRRPSYVYLHEFFEYVSVQFKRIDFKMVDGVYTDEISIQDGEFCTDDRFLGDIDSIQNLGTTGTFICPPKDFQFKLKGSLTSNNGHAQIASTNVELHDSIFSSEMNVQQEEFYQVDQIDKQTEQFNDPA
eukprot:403347419